MSYTDYNGQCVGRLMDFLYKYSHEFDRCYFDGKKNILKYVDDPQSIIASYTWDNDGDSNIPTFEFKQLISAKNDWEIGSARWVETMHAQQKHHKPMIIRDEIRAFEYRNPGKQFTPYSKKEQELREKLSKWNTSESLKAQIFGVPCSSVQTKKRYTASGRHVDQSGAYYEHNEQRNSA